MARRPLGVDRLRETYAYVQRHGSASVSDIADALQVSLQTVRRDLHRLEDQRLVERVYGGAVLAGGGPAGPSSRPDAPARTAGAAARRMADAAATLVRDGSTIFLSGGSVAEGVVPGLADREGLTVVTNAVRVAHALGGLPQVQVIVLGGVLRHAELTLLGPLTEQAVARLSIDQVLYDAHGVDPSVGLYGSGLAEAELARLVIATGAELCVLAGGAQLGRRGPVRIAGPAQIAVLVTDEGAPADDLARLREEGVRVVQA
jgi:DeoR/GlpR family transcriptional regulator of sugar metabolism